MKNKTYFLLAVLLMNVLQSCKDDVCENDVANLAQPEAVDGLNLRALYSENHVIPVSEAGEIALKAPDMFAGESTRAKDLTPRTIESIGVYGRTNNSLRSANATEDTLVYVFNFEDNRGYAIVAGDDRIPTQILAYVDEGVLENEVDNPALQYALSLMQNYVESSIDNFERSKDSLLKVAEENSFVVDAKTAETRAIYTGTSYRYLGEITTGPLIKVTWGQGDPYNMYVEKNCTKTQSNGGKAPTGCLATATAQIMSYWKYPAKVNNHTMDWNDMCLNSTPQTYSQKTSIARLMAEIGNGMEMEYECDGSGTTSSNACFWLNSIGYVTRFSKDFNIPDAISAISSNMPVVLDGCAKINIKNSWWENYYDDCHAWVIDGWKRIYYEQVNYRINTKNGKYASTKSITVEDYFHNNWGYVGKGNGYFAAGCFNMQDPLNYDNLNGSLQGDFRYGNEMFCVLSK
ncbi:MAG: C10 family peptidase [Paludibacteraceae bacterium]|nr:C10 family peptidase [Paludibacteraceae bacterium]MEE1083487.1 C10 family peptidase [Paludibacteraceae bacterium]